MGVLGSRSLDHQLQQAVVQVLALGMEQARAKVEAAACSSASSSSSSSSGSLQVWGDAPLTPGSAMDRLPQLGVYLVYMVELQMLLQQHGGRLLAGGDPATAMQLVAMLRGMAAANLQVGCGGVGPHLLFISPIGRGVTLCHIRTRGDWDWLLVDVMH